MITYKLVGRGHPVCGDDCPSFASPAMKAFWNTRSLDSCDMAVVAYDGEKLVGFFRFYNRYPTLWAGGTYLQASYRDRGIAAKLWQRAIKFLKPDEVCVTTTSRGGQKLVQSLKRKYKTIVWDINRNFR